MPVSHKYQSSGGRLVDQLVSPKIAVYTEQDISGWGETCPFGSAYTEAFAAGARSGALEIAPQLLG